MVTVEWVGGGATSRRRITVDSEYFIYKFKAKLEVLKAF